MFKTADKISKAIDIVIKSTEEMTNEERKEEAIAAVHQLSNLYSNCISDIKQKS